MHMIKKSLAAVVGVAALALGGSAIAGAASKSSTAQSSSSGAPAAVAQGNLQAQGNGPGPGGGPGHHVGANGQQEQPLSSDVAAKVAAAAKAKVPGATLERTETDVDHGSPYEAHLRKSDGTELEVLVNKDFQVTAVNTMQHP